MYEYIGTHIHTDSVCVCVCGVVFMSIKFIPASSKPNNLSIRVVSIGDRVQTCLISIVVSSEWGGGAV